MEVQHAASRSHRLRKRGIGRHGSRGCACRRACGTRPGPERGRNGADQLGRIAAVDAVHLIGLPILGRVLRRRSVPGRLPPVVPCFLLRAAAPGRRGPARKSAPPRPATATRATTASTTGRATGTARADSRGCDELRHRACVNFARLRLAARVLTHACLASHHAATQGSAAAWRLDAANGMVTESSRGSVSRSRACRAPASRSRAAPISRAFARARSRISS